MKETNRTIADHARRIDRELLAAGRTTLTELAARTGLSAEELLPALGWLACEGRIDIDKEEIRTPCSEFYF